VGAFGDALLASGRGGIVPDLIVRVNLSFARPRGEWEPLLNELECFDEAELTGSFWEPGGA
jgi:hypothetical protein